MGRKLTANLIGLKALIVFFTYGLVAILVSKAVGPYQAEKGLNPDTYILLGPLSSLINTPAEDYVAAFFFNIFAVMLILLAVVFESTGLRILFVSCSVIYWFGVGVLYYGFTA